MDHGIFNVHTNVNAFDCIQGIRTRVRESALKVDSWKKSFAALGNRTCVSGVTVRCTSNWATSPPLNSVERADKTACRMSSCLVAGLRLIVDQGLLACFTELVHAFLLEYFHGSITHKTGRLVYSVSWARKLVHWGMGSERRLLQVGDLNNVLPWSDTHVRPVLTDPLRLWG